MIIKNALYIVILVVASLNTVGLKAQLTPCPQGSCPNDCRDGIAKIINNLPPGCDLCWLWSYPSTNCSMNPGGCVPAGQNRDFIPQCARCADGPCQCPNQLWLADPGNTTGYAFATQIPPTGTAPVTYAVAYTACAACSGMLRIVVTPPATPGGQTIIDVYCW